MKSIALFILMFVSSMAFCQRDIDTLAMIHERMFRDFGEVISDHYADPDTYKLTTTINGSFVIEMRFYRVKPFEYSFAFFRKERIVFYEIHQWNGYRALKNRVINFDIRVRHKIHNFNKKR